MIKLLVISGWCGFLLGISTGAVIGLLFARDNWLGGYSSWPRRLVRLGHISFFGLGLVNLLFAFTATLYPSKYPNWVDWAVPCLIAGAVTMPTICFLSAWKKPLRHLFPIPVVCVATGILLGLGGWL